MRPIHFFTAALLSATCLGGGTSAKAGQASVALDRACGYIERRADRPPQYGDADSGHFLDPVVRACREIEDRQWLKADKQGGDDTERRVSAWFAYNSYRALKGVEGQGPVNDAALLLALQHRDVFETAESVIFLADLAESEPRG